MYVIHMMNDLHRLDLNLLRVFDVLMEERSVSRAADRLNLTQPATSNALNRLRQALGDPLMVRSGNQMIPTPFAEEFHSHIRRALHEISRGLNKLKIFTPAEMTGSIKIGIDQYCLHLFGAPLLSQLRKDAPKLKISLVNTPPHEREAQMLRGDFDFIVGQVWQQTPQIGLDVLFTENFVGVMRQDHVFAEKGKPTLNDYLSVEHLLFSEIGQVPRNVDLGLKRRGKERRVITTVPSFSVLGQLLEGSDAILNIGSRMANVLQQQFSVETFTIPINVPGFDIGVQWPANDGQSPMNLWFRSLLAGLCR